MKEFEIFWSEPLELFKPGIYSTDEKFIEHLRKFVSDLNNPILDKKGIIMFLSGNIKPEEKLSLVIVEGSAGYSVRERIMKKKGQIRELKCLYKNYKDENLFIKVGEIKEQVSEEDEKNIVCSLIEDFSPSCNEPCKKFEKVKVNNKGNSSPLHLLISSE